MCAEQWVLAANQPQKKHKIMEKEISKKKRIKKAVTRGRVYIKATYNNTIVNFTDTTGNTLVLWSATKSGFRGPKKATPYAAGIIIKQAMEKVQEYGLHDVDVFVKGVGSGRDGALRAIAASELNILSVKDVTPIPHNGCRAKKIRRV